jgi:hypothetical protein
LEEVEKKMREVTLTAPSYRELKQIYMVRDLYMPKDDHKYSKEQVNEIYKRFARAYSKLSENP